MKKTSASQIVAAVAAALLVVCSLIILKYNNITIFWRPNRVIYCWMVIWAIYVVVSLIGNKMVAAIVPSVAAVLNLVPSLSLVGTNHERILHLCAFCALAVFAWIGAITGKKELLIKKLWFVPGAIYVIRASIWVLPLLLRILTPNLIKRADIIILYASDIIPAVIFFAFAFWMCHDVEAKSVVRAAAAQQTLHREPAVDRLLELKKLWDAGVITQEEFEEKKKQILMK